MEEFLKPMDIPQTELAIMLQVPYQRVNENINGKRGVTPPTALRLAKVFGTSEDLGECIQMMALIDNQKKW